MTLKVFLAKYIDVVLALLIGIFSFLQFSPLFSSHYNTDHAVHVLMSADFDFVKDYFFWGQARLGSFFPMITSVFVKLGIEPIVAGSIMKWLVLFCTFLVGRKWIKSIWGRVLFAIAILLPHFEFIPTLFLGQPYAEQFLMLLLSFWCVSSIRMSDSIYRKVGLVLGYVISSWIAVWISMSSVPCLVISALYLYSVFFPIKSAVKFIAGFIIAGVFAFLFYKFSSNIEKSYNDPSGFSQHGLVGFQGFFKSIKIFLNYAWEGLLFKTAWMSIVSTYTFVLALLAGFYAFFKNWDKELLKNLSPQTYFLLLALAGFFPVMISAWVQVANVPFRYFAAAYLFIIVFVLIALEKYKNHAWLKIFVTAFILFGIYTGFQRESHGFRNDENTRAEVKALKNAGLVGAYWYSYSIESFAPDKISSTPHDKDFVRNRDKVPEFLDHDLIYVVKNEFLESFPDTIEQFGSSYIRLEAPEVIVANAILKEYQKIEE